MWEHAYPSDRHEHVYTESKQFVRQKATNYMNLLIITNQQSHDKLKGMKRARTYPFHASHLK
jgi:hypothetical protein